VREDVRSLLEVDEALFTREFARRERFSGKAFVKPARAALATLRAQAEGREVWDEEVWPAHRLTAAALGAFPPTRTTRIDFRGVEPPFLQAALKRWAKGRLLADYAFGGVARYVSSVRLFCQWLREEGIALARPQSIDRALLEAYRLHVAGAPMATATRIARLGDLNQVLADVRAAEWLPIPPGAAYLRGEIPRPREELLKNIDGHVLAPDRRPTQPGPPGAAERPDGGRDHAGRRAAHPRRAAAPARSRRDGRGRPPLPGLLELQGQARGGGAPDRAGAGADPPPAGVPAPELARGHPLQYLDTYTPASPKPTMSARPPPVVSARKRGCRSTRQPPAV
jgi:hypothetical protein